jgi:hypothetical protein
VPHCHAKDGFDHPKSKNIAAKGPDPDMQYVAYRSMLLYQHILANVCLIPSDINLHCHFYPHNLISVKDDPLTSMDNKSANTLPIPSAVVLDCFPSTTAMIPQMVAL